MSVISLVKSLSNPCKLKWGEEVEKFTRTNAVVDW